MHPCRLRQRAQDLLHAIQGPGQQWRVVTIGRGAHGSERMPSASTPTERLMPPFPRSTGLLPDLSPPQGALVMQQSTAISERRATRAREASAISAMRGSSVSPGSVPGGQGNGKFSKQSRLLQVGLPPSLPSPCRGEFARAQTSWALEWSTPKKRVNYSPPTSRTAFCERGGLRQSAPLSGSPRAASTAARTRLETW